MSSFSEPLRFIRLLKGDLISKRFTRIVSKSKLFHSFKNTATAKLESAGTSENMTADIFSHHKNTHTFGTYVDATSI